MTLRIMKSRVEGRDFLAEVREHVEKLTRWGMHMDAVRANPKEYEAYPAPVAPPDVEAAIRRDLREDGGTNFVMDFDVVDDGPSPDEILRGKKNILFAEVDRLEQAAADAVVPPGKRRLRALRASAAAAKDEKKRSDADRDFISAYEAEQKTLDAIILHAAEQHAAIEDLTAKDVDDWKPQEFPK